MNREAPSATAATPVRPPDFLLPKGAPGSARTAVGTPEIYLSWGGSIYGPAGAEEVVAGVRTSCFEPDTLFWFEGEANWMPVEDFPGLVDGGHHTLAARRVGSAPEDAPPLPSAGEAPAPRASRGQRRRSGRNRQKNSPRRHGRSSGRGRLIVFLFILLAAVVTVGLIFLLMQF
ncbi:MAG: DUF4339 domain-containing protein [Chthoniobacterales bacterium]